MPMSKSDRDLLDLLLMIFVAIPVIVICVCIYLGLWLGLAVCALTAVIWFACKFIARWHTNYKAYISREAQVARRKEAARRIAKGGL